MPSWLGHYFESADANFVVDGDINDPKMTLKSQLFITNQETSNMDPSWNVGYTWNSVETRLESDRV